MLALAGGEYTKKDGPGNSDCGDEQLGRNRFEILRSWCRNRNADYSANQSYPDL